MGCVRVQVCTVLTCMVFVVLKTDGGLIVRVRDLTECVVHKRPYKSPERDKSNQNV